MAIINGTPGFTQLTKLNVTEALLEDGSPVASIPSDLTEGQMVKFDESIENFAYAGITVDETTGIVTFDNSIVVPSGSVGIGEVLELSEGIADLVIVDLLKDAMSFSVKVDFDADTGSGVPTYTDFGSAFVLNINTDDSENLTDNPLTFSLIGTVVAPDKRLIDQITIRGGSAMTNFRVSVTDNATGLVIRYIPSKTAFDGDQDGLDTIAGDNTFFFASDDDDTPGNFHLGFIPFILEENQIIDFIIVADSVDMLGNLAGTPFLVAEAHDGPDVELLTAAASFTEGSVLFADPLGVITEDNTNFFWNDTTNVLEPSNISLEGLITFEYDSSTQTTGATRSSDDWHVAASVFKQSFSVIAQDDENDSMYLRSDGLKMYMAGSENGLVYEYDLGTSWDISTSVFLQSFDPSMTNIAGLFFRPNGLQMFLINVSTDEVEEFALTIAWDISTASTVQTIDLQSIGGGTLPHDLKFKSDGLAFYVAEISDEDVEQFNMTTPWDISTATLTTTFNTNAPDFSVSFKLDGTMMFVVNRSGIVSEFNLTTPWLVDTAELVSTTDLSVLDVRGMFFKTDGSKIYLMEENTSTVMEFNIGLDISAPLNLRIPLNGDTVGINFVNETGFASATIQYEDALQTLALSAVEMSLAASDVMALSADGITLNTTGDIVFNSDIFIDDIGQRILITSVGGTGTPSFELANSSFVNKLVIEYDQQINNVNITGTVDTTVDTTSGSLFLHSATDVRLDARSGNILLDATGNVITNTSLGVNITPVNTLHVFDNDSLTITSGIAVEQQGTGDTGIHFILTGGQEWTLGIDNSIGDGFSIEPSLSLNVDPVFFIETGGDIGFGTSSPNANLHISDLSGAVVNLQLAGNDGSFLANVAGNGQTNLQSSRTAGVVNYGFQGLPVDGTSNVNFRFGVSSGSTGDQRIQLFEPNGSVLQTELCTSGGTTFLNSQGGGIAIGKTTVSTDFILDIVASLDDIVGLYDAKGVTFESGNNDNTNSTDLFFNRGDAGFNQSEFHLFNGNNNVDTRRLFHMNFTDAGTTGGLSIRFDGSVAVGIGENDEANSSFQVVGSIAKSIVAKTAAYTLTALDYTVTGDATSAAFTLTLPTAVNIQGRIYVLKKIDSSVNIVTVDASVSQTIDGVLTFDLTDEGESITIQSDNANWIII